VELGWLERVRPAAAEVLRGLAGPVVVVPVLLSTGYHVKVDIAALVGDRPRTVVARQLGPDRRITAIVADRLRPGRHRGADVVLFGAGSSDPEALAHLAEVATDLQALLRADEPGTSPVVHPRFLTDVEGWRRGIPDGADLANYLLAPGHFNDRLPDRAARLGSRWWAPPLGAHPALAAVIWDRYDEALAAAEDLGAGSGAGAG